MPPAAKQHKLDAGNMTLHLSSKEFRRTAKWLSKTFAALNIELVGDSCRELPADERTRLSIKRLLRLGLA
jgi:hypothetical protein